MVRSGQEDVLGDLQYLRKSAGLTLRRLQNAPAVIRACGGDDQPLETVRERLLSALRSLPAGRDRDALAAALGDGVSTLPLLKQRREQYGATVGRGSYVVAEGENRALAELALRLMSSYYAGSATPAQLHLPHGGFLLQTVAITTTELDLRFVASEQTRTLVSLVDGARGFIYGSYSPTELRDFKGCRLHETRTGPGGVVHELHFPRPLKRGESHTFSFCEAAPGEKAVALPEVDFAGQTFESPTLRYTQTVRFVGLRPDQIWTYDKLSRIERPGRPRSELQGASVSFDFHDLYGGLAAGIAWTTAGRQNSISS